MPELAEKCLTHSRRDPEAWALTDGRGIFLTYVCKDCLTTKRQRYRPEIFDHYTQADCDEQIEPEDW